MNPQEVSAALRHIATKLDASKNPDRGLVVQAVKQILAGMESEALPQSGTGKQMLLHMLTKAAKAVEKGDDKLFKELLGKLTQQAL